MSHTTPQHTWYQYHRPLQKTLHPTKITNGSREKRNETRSFFLFHHGVSSTHKHQVFAAMTAPVAAPTTTPPCAIVKVDDPFAPLDPAHNGKLVYMSGKFDLAGPAFDPVFGKCTFKFDPHAPDDYSCISMIRKVESYIWVKHCAPEYDPDCYYQKKWIPVDRWGNFDGTSWSDRQVVSTKFRHPTGHNNPEKALYGLREKVLHGQVRLGNYIVSPDLFVSDATSFGGWCSHTGDVKYQLSHITNATIKAKASTLGEDAFWVGSTRRHNDDEASADIGDLKVQFMPACHPSPVPVTVIALLDGQTLKPYHVKDKKNKTWKVQYLGKGENVQLNNFTRHIPRPVEDTLPLQAMCFAVGEGRPQRLSSSNTSTAHDGSNLSFGLVCVVFGFALAGWYHHYWKSSFLRGGSIVMNATKHSSIELKTLTT